MDFKIKEYNIFQKHACWKCSVQCITGHLVWHYILHLSFIVKEQRTTKKHELAEWFSLRLTQFLKLWASPGMGRSVKLLSGAFHRESFGSLNQLWLKNRIVLNPCSTWSARGLSWKLNSFFFSLFSCMFFFHPLSFPDCLSCLCHVSLASRTSTHTHTHASCLKCKCSFLSVNVWHMTQS